MLEVLKTIALLCTIHGGDINLNEVKLYTTQCNRYYNLCLLERPGVWKVAIEYKLRSCIIRRTNEHIETDWTLHSNATRRSFGDFQDAGEEDR